uniref:Protein kinase domain-containing protein n=1 Tax=Arcella intermedia TaxID=1963864 RepID=A0A6B2LC62_9EUKA
MGGTLSEASKAYQFKDPHIAFITRQISNGVKYLHQKNWAHRDLKSSNVMLQVDGSIKIIDFGLASDMGNGGKTKMLGSAFWIPPEMIIKEQHSLPADIWSLSVCVLEMFYQSPPYAVSPLKCMFEVATVGLQHYIPKGCSEEAKDWLTRSLCYDQTKRSNIIELLKHPWLNQPVPVKELSAILKSVFMSNTIESLM